MTQRGTDVTYSTKLTAAQVVLYRGGQAGPSAGIRHMEENEEGSGARPSSLSQEVEGAGEMV